MCGIVGWIDWEEDLTAQSCILDKMSQAIVHRGPDACSPGASAPGGGGS